MDYHKPVLLEECIELLQIDPNGIYVDCTFGGGGHSKKIIEKLNKGKLIAFDKDPDAVANSLDDPRFELVQEDFEFIEKELIARGITKVNGILADLGISSHQIDEPKRGFSFRWDGPLDMRMHNQSGVTAAEILNHSSEEELLQIFWNYGEVKNARKLVRNILQARLNGPFQTTRDLKQIAEEVAPAKGAGKYLAQVFQAIRIEVNAELDSLKVLLHSGPKILNKKGRMVIISYHSLEDRLVKRFFKSGNLEGKAEKDFYGNPLSPWNLITRKAIKASEEEIKNNPRARSARLRAAEMV